MQVVTLPLLLRLRAAARTNIDSFAQVDGRSGVTSLCT